MKVAVTGGTGFLGSAVVEALLNRGEDVWIITRRKEKVKPPQNPRLRIASWAELADQKEQLQFDVIINFAGETIDQRWNDAFKERVLSSRVDAAHQVAAAVSNAEHKPRVVINASGIAGYGTSLVDAYDEDSPCQVVDFLSSVVEKWEAAADTIKDTRVVKLRIGIVFAAKGGALEQMLLPYRFFIGGRVGSGQQWMSWIHREDFVRLVLFCIDNEAMVGAVNATAPQPVTNDAIGGVIRRVMGRPHWLPKPAWMLRLALGELGDVVVNGQRVLPKRALDAGFQFKYVEVEPALRDLLKLPQ